MLSPARGHAPRPPKEEERERLDRDLAAYIAAGGQIQQVASNESDVPPKLRVGIE